MVVCARLLCCLQLFWWALVGAVTLAKDDPTAKAANEAKMTDEERVLAANSEKGDACTPVDGDDGSVLKKPSWKDAYPKGFGVPLLEQDPIFTDTAAGMSEWFLRIRDTGERTFWQGLDHESRQHYLQVGVSHTTRPAT